MSFTFQIASDLSIDVQEVFEFCPISNYLLSEMAMPILIFITFWTPVRTKSKITAGRGQFTSS